MSYPRVKIKSSELGIIELVEGVLVSVPFDLAGFVERRNFGEFANKAVYLNSKYVWIIGNDAGGALIAIPTRRS